MSTEPCGAGFSQQGRKKFIDATIQKALDRIEAKEAQDLLARDGVEPLSQCPFCGFIAIYPLIEPSVNLYGQDPTCEIISCRIFHNKSHEPWGCAGVVRGQKSATDAQRVGEAKSMALIRE
jgi:TRIAD3 protein (E3 ubiquitin-protein ligase RNF216)